MRDNVLDRFFDFVDKYYYLILVLIFLITLFNLFYELKDTPIDSWDEARHGVSAYEMLKKNNFVVNTYSYRNDYWNLKPPMSFWLIMLGYKMAGFNTLGLRLYSALAAFLTVFIIALFVKYKHGRVASLIAATALATSPQYIINHSARTGDADALFVLFFTLAMVAMILSERNVKWLYLAGLAFSLAFLTKSWHAINIVIIGLIYLIFTGTIFRLKYKQWFFFLASALGPILAWGALRYSRDGIFFFLGMVFYDLLARTGTTLEGHVGGKLFYIELLKSNYLLWLQLLVVAAIIYVVLHKDKIFTAGFFRENKNYMAAVALWILVPLLTFSKAETKIAWYILPLYPVLALIIGAFSGRVIRGGKRVAIAQLIILLLFIQGLYRYEPLIKEEILMYQGHINRVTFKNMATLKKFKGNRAYMLYELGATKWRQSDLLAAELYGDIIPVNAGLEPFLADKDKNSLLFVSKRIKDAEALVIQKYNLKIKAQDKSVYVLSK